jgi:hypothetical protein
MGWSTTRWPGKVYVSVYVCSALALTVWLHWEKSTHSKKQLPRFEAEHPKSQVTTRQRFRPSSDRSIQSPSNPHTPTPRASHHKKLKWASSSRATTLSRPLAHHRPPLRRRRSRRRRCSASCGACSKRRWTDLGGEAARRRRGASWRRSWLSKTSRRRSRTS